MAVWEIQSSTTITYERLITQIQVGDGTMVQTGIEGSHCKREP
jgi:hypothetical protein